MPKHYIQGYDGDDIWLALTEDEVKQFESEKEMPLSSFDNAQYRERIFQDNGKANIPSTAS